MKGNDRKVVTTNVVKDKADIVRCLAEGSPEQRHDRSNTNSFRQGTSDECARKHEIQMSPKGVSSRDCRLGSKVHTPYLGRSQL